MTSTQVIQLGTCLLGGGFAGVACARALGRGVRRGKITGFFAWWLWRTVYLATLVDLIPLSLHQAPASNP